MIYLLLLKFLVLFLGTLSEKQSTLRVKEKQISTRNNLLFFFFKSSRNILISPNILIIFTYRRLYLYLKRTQTVRISNDTTYHIQCHIYILKAQYIFSIFFSLPRFIVILAHAQQILFCTKILPRAITVSSCFWFHKRCKIPFCFHANWI